MVAPLDKPFRYIVAKFHFDWKLTFSCALCATNLWELYYCTNLYNNQKNRSNTINTNTIRNVSLEIQTRFAAATLSAIRVFLVTCTWPHCRPMVVVILVVVVFVYGHFNTFVEGFSCIRYSDRWGAATVATSHCPSQAWLQRRPGNFLYLYFTVSVHPL